MGNKLKKIILDLISFNTPTAIVINISLIFLLLLFVPTSHLNYLPIKSFYGNVIIPYIFKNSCPTQGVFTNCGFYSIGQTRAMSRLLHGDLSEALKLNKFVIVLFFALFGVWLANILKLIKRHKKISNSS